jgi:SNF2 family DNA or RNA helicase
MIRGLAKKILILVPSSLVLHWSNELNEKFNIPAVTERKGYEFQSAQILIASLDKAKRSPYKETIQEQEYDLLLIDEAHKLKNHKTKAYEFVKSIHKKYCLLLTATPFQNQLSELYYLISLLKPGYLGTPEAFFKQYGSKSNAVSAYPHLQKLVHQVMIRNRREQTGKQWTKRQVQAIPVSFSTEEQAVYDQVTQLKAFPGLNRFSILTMQREACSSREALYLTLKKLMAQCTDAELLHAFQNLVEAIKNINQRAKAEKVLSLIHDIQDKVIIFTEYRATQLYLGWFLRQHNISSVPFRGGFKRTKKEWMTNLFRNQAQVLIATEAGGEGVNLQFCHHLINYDLPWNPMKIEQRIGRIHRFGQEEDVSIYNLSTRATIEDHMLTLLYNKIALFENVIGELDTILNNLQLHDIEGTIKDIFLQSESEGEIAIQMDNLTSVILSEKEYPAEVAKHAAE